MIERLTSSDRRKVKNSLKQGNADIFDVLNALNYRIIDTPVLKNHDACKCFLGFVYPLTTEAIQKHENKVLPLVDELLKPKIIHSMITHNYEKYNGYPILLEDPERELTKQEILKYYYLAIQKLIKGEKQPINKVKTPFDTNKIHLLESEETLNSFISQSLDIDNYCEVIDYLKKHGNIGSIDISKLNTLFNKCISIQSNNENLDNISIINKIRNCMRHNKYTIRRNGVVHINDKGMILDIMPNFFDDFVGTYIELLENDCPLNANFNQILCDSIAKGKLDFNEIAKNGVYDFSQINRDTGFENNIGNIFTNDGNQITLNQNQINLLKKYFGEHKFNALNLANSLNGIILNIPVNKIYYRKIMQMFLNKFLIENKNYTINQHNTFLDTIKNYIKLQFVKFYYINKSDLNLGDDTERHLRNCFTHGWYTENLFNGEILVQDKRFNRKTGLREITHENIYDINSLYNSIESSGGFSNILDKKQDNLGGFIVGNIKADNTNSISIEYEYHIF